MNRKLIMLVLSVGLIAGIMTSTADAWEFEMDGIFTWQYTKAGQLGDHGFFGKFDVDNSAGNNGRYGSLNGWFGPRFGVVSNPVEMTSGSDAAYNVIYMSTNMQVRLNPAIRVRGNYYLAAWNYLTPNTDATADLVSYGYPSMMFDGVQRSFSPGYWRTLWLTAQLPFGEIAVGKRPSSFGMGLFADGADNQSSESLSLFAFSGPFRFGWSFYPARRIASNRYFNEVADVNALRGYQFGPVVTYRQGPFDLGVSVQFVSAHNGLEGSTALNKFNTYDGPVWDRSDHYGSAYMKYNNGRFFINYEFDWYNRIQRYSSNNVLASNYADILDRATTRYIEHYRTGLETGVLAGPAKVSLLAAWCGGGDRRMGSVRGINQGDLTGSGVGSTDATSFSNTSVFRPYSFLAVYMYGLGTSINAATGYGYVDDAMTYGARLDYAVAANLNLFGTFFWADRVGNAYGWGFLRPATLDGGLVDVPGAIERAYRGTTNVNASANVAPNIPDNNLGWEIDAGFDWKLLEGLTLRSTFAYWVPGKWFSYAAMDKANPNWLQGTLNNPGALAGGGNWGTTPGRTIDPVYGVDFRLEGEF